MPRFFTKRNNGKYVNTSTGVVQNTTPEMGWRIKRNNKTGSNFYINLSGKEKSTWKRPISFFTKRNGKYVNESGKVYDKKPTEGWFVRNSVTTGQKVYQNLSGKVKEATFTRPGTVSSRSSTPSSSRSQSPSSSAQSTPRPETPAPVSSNLASKLAAAERELAELKRQLASSAPVPVAAPSNNPAVEKFKKMLKMGIPRTAVEQKMRMEGLEPSMLNGSAAAPATVSNAPSVPLRPAGNPMAGLLAGITGGPKLKKTNGPQKAVVEEKDPKKNMAKAIGNAAAAKRAQMASTGNTRSIEERLANLKKAKGPAPMNPLKAAITGFKRSNLINTTVKRNGLINTTAKKQAPLSIAEQAMAKRATMFASKAPKNNAFTGVSSDPSSPKSTTSEVVPSDPNGGTQYSKTNKNGSVLPEGVTRVHDGNTQIYALDGTNTTAWSLEELLMKRNNLKPKTRKGGRRNRKNRKSRRSN